MVKCRCGVDLGPNERVCPVCGTPVGEGKKVITFPMGKSELSSDLYLLLKEVAEALYYIAEEAKPAGVNLAKYIELYERIVDVMGELGCLEAKELELR